MWVEIEWSYERKKWCIQDCMGHCLTHIEHLHAEVGDENNEDYNSLADQAIEKAKQMIRDGMMPSPEDAKAAFEERQLKDKS